MVDFPHGAKCLITLDRGWGWPRNHAVHPPLHFDSPAGSQGLGAATRRAQCLVGNHHYWRSDWKWIVATNKVGSQYFSNRNRASRYNEKNNKI